MNEEGFDQSLEAIWSCGREVSRFDLVQHLLQLGYSLVVFDGVVADAPVEEERAREGRKILTEAQHRFDRRWYKL